MKIFLSFNIIFALALAYIFGASGGLRAQTADNHEMKDGDIILLPLNCWACYLIEAQEKSIYSHMGVFLELEEGDFVFEAWGKVKLTPLREFLNRSEEGQRPRLFRFKEIAFNSIELRERIGKFIGHSYDSDFLWNNYDDLGEKLYCSELVYKVFYPFYGEELPIKKMKYDVNRAHWESYFGGPAPDGKWGNAPADFEKSSLFEDLGEL